jgi:hypothetical protein
VLLLVTTSATGGEAALRAWLAGAGFTAAFYHWLATQGVLLLVVVAALLGLLWVPVGVVAHRMLRDRPGPRRLGLAVAVVPAVWVLAEAVRSVPVLGGPWAVLGLTQWNAPLLGGAAALGGVWLLSVLVVAVNVALTAAVAPPSGGTAGDRLLAATGAGALLGLAALGGWVALDGGAPAEPASPQAVRIALVQPGDIADPAERLAVHAALTAPRARPSSAGPSAPAPTRNGDPGRPHQRAPGAGRSGAARRRLRSASAKRDTESRDSTSRSSRQPVAARVCGTCVQRQLRLRVSAVEASRRAWSLTF